MLSHVLPLDGIPSDGTPEEVYKQIHQILFISYTTLAGAGILFAIFCMFFNIIFRKRKWASTPHHYLSHVTIHSNTIHLHSNTIHPHSNTTIFIPIPPSSFQYHHPHSNTTIFIPIPPSSFQYHHLHSNTTILIPIPPSSFQYHHLYSKPSILIPIPPSSFQYHHPHSNTTIFIPNHPSSFQYHHLHSKPSIIILMLYLHSNSTDCHIINPHSSLSVKFSVTRSITTRSTLMLWGQDLPSWAQLNVDVTFIGLGLDTKKCSERCWNKFKLINSPESLSHRKCLDGGSNDVPFYPIFLLQDCASDKSQPKLSDHPWNHPTVHYCHIFCFSYYWCHLPNHLLPCELLIGVWMCILYRALARIYLQIVHSTQVWNTLSM